MVTIPAEPDTRAHSTGPGGLTERRIHAWCIWCGPVTVVLLFGGLLLAGFVPPPSPGQDAGQVAAGYADGTDLRRLGLLLVFLGGGFSVPFVVAIDRRLRQVPGAGAMALQQVIGGAMGALAIVLPALFFMTAAFRPEREPQITQALHDLGFIPFIANAVPFLLQTIAIAVAVLSQGPAPVLLPRWLGWFNLWVAFLALPGMMVIFFKGGAFAWNGVLAFWVVAVVFGAWFWVMFGALLRGLRHEASEAR